MSSSNNTRLSLSDWAIIAAIVFGVITAIGTIKTCNEKKADNCYKSLSEAQQNIAAGTKCQKDIEAKGNKNSSIKDLNPCFELKKRGLNSLEYLDKNAECAEIKILVLQELKLFYQSYQIEMETNRYQKKIDSLVIQIKKNQK